jgi:hypothetical protein
MAASKILETCYFPSDERDLFNANVVCGQIGRQEVWQHVGYGPHSSCPKFSHIFPFQAKPLDSPKKKKQLFI